MSTLRNQWLPIISRHALLLILIGLVALFATCSPEFRNPANLVNIVEQQSMIGIVACGMLLMILLGGFDLSVGAVGAAASVVAAWAMPRFGIAAGVVAALLFGALVGTINGLLIAGLRINAFVATLGMQTLVTGLLLVSTQATPVYGVPESFTVIGLGRLGPVPVAAMIFAAVATGLWAMLRYTVFGQHIFAVGGNAQASYVAGVPTLRVTVGAYALCSWPQRSPAWCCWGRPRLGSPRRPPIGP